MEDNFEKMDTLKNDEKSKMTNYEKLVCQRTYVKYFLGLISRWKMNITYERARRIARRRGAKIGKNVVMSISLAKKANPNLTIGDNTSIQTDYIDLRAKVKIGSNVIIGYGTEIITVSHYIDSPEWEHKYYGIEIDDYAWIPTKVLVLPSCTKIGRGAVIGSGSVVVRNVEAMSVVSGNPAKQFKVRECVHSKLVVPHLMGGDYYLYRDTWKQRTVISKR